MDNLSFISPIPTKYSASTRIEHLSASVNRREAVNSMSAQNLVQPIGHQPRLFTNVFTPNKFKMNSKKMCQSQNVYAKKKQEQITSPSAFDETPFDETTHLNCGGSDHEMSPHLKLPEKSPNG
jgi:hypothetical protein